jgi:tetratricopeptide (TPR) repeat protein
MYFLQRCIVFCLFAVFPLAVAYGQESAREMFKFAKFKFDKGEYTVALNLVNKALAYDKTYPSAYFLRADVNFRLGDYGGVVSDINTALDLTRSQSASAPEYQLLRARAYLNLEAWDKAEEDLELLFAGTEEYADAHYARALIRRRGGDLGGALEDLDRAILMRADQAGYHELRARIREALLPPFASEEHYRNILGDLNVAVALEPENYDFLAYRSRISLRCRLRNEAVADLSRMIALKPGEAGAYAERGLLHMQDSRFDLAVQDFSQSIRIDPGDYRSYRNRAICQHNLERQKAALPDYNQAIALMSREIQEAQPAKSLQELLADTHILRGHCLNLLGQQDDACQDFLRAFNLGNKKGLNYHRKYCGVY